jgi:2-amino-4-hydroxy-6-hydroxymethyldihydropteridine diphosphokinase
MTDRPSPLETHRNTMETNPRTRAGIGLGANMGDKEGQIRAALDALSRLSETRLLAVSRLYRTAPVGVTDQDWFLNAALTVETGLGVRELLAALLGIERDLGRVRTLRWGPRKIDLDILFFGDRVIDEDDLVIPHPRMHERRFVLAPLAEVAPDWVHPRLGRTINDLLAGLPDDEEWVEPWDSFAG